MSRSFDYPINLKKAQEGGYIVTFPDFPEAITQGETLEDTLQEASDCLEEAVANRMIMKLDIPESSLIKKNSHYVSLPIELAAKAALYISLRELNISNNALAKKLNCDEKVVRRLIDPHYASKLPRIEAALGLLGSRLTVQVTH